jgi:ribonucleotide reductase alpha subunit
LLANFKYIVPQGRILYGCGNREQYITLSNCYLIKTPSDSYAGILRADEELVNISKRGGGVGLEISNLRPENSSTKNASRTSTGIIPFMKRYSNSSREVGQCIKFDQQVLTDIGLKSIENVYINDKVWTKEGWVKVINKFDNGTKKIYKIKTKYGFSIECSEDHIFLTLQNNQLTQIRLKDLVVTDKIVLISGQQIQKEELSLDNKHYIPPKSAQHQFKIVNLPNKLDKKLAYIIGYSYGDGHFVKNPITKIKEDLCLSVSDLQIKTKLLTYIKDIFNIISKVNNGSGKVEVIRIGSKDIAQFLEQNNLAKEYSKDIKMPELIKNSSGEIQGAFLSGYFDADAHIGNTGENQKPHFRASSISKKFIDDCQNLLISNGIISKIQPFNHKQKWNTCYRLNIVGTFSQNKLIKFCSESIKAQNIKKISLEDHILTPFTYKYNKKQFLSLQAFIKQNHKECLLIQDEIVEIIENEYAKTYDLELEKEHMFWCEGFYVHNSGRRGAIKLDLNIHHPQALDFAKVKRDKELINGANISFKVTDEFLNAVECNGEYEQRFPVDKDSVRKFSRKASAKKLWNEIIKSVWLVGDPGLLFWGNVEKEDIGKYYQKEGFSAVATNPCTSGGSSWVLARNGRTIQIYDLNVGDKIWSIDGWTTVTNKINRGIKQTYKYTTDHSYIICTDNHNVISDGQKKQIKDCEYIDGLFSPSNDQVITVKIKKVEKWKEEEVFDITVDNKSHTFWCNSFNISNCGEITLSDNYDSCRLLVLNLYNYVRNPFTHPSFDFDLLYSHAQIAQRLMDDFIDLELECIDRIIEKIKIDPEDDFTKSRELSLWQTIRKTCESGRRTGVGFTGLADVFAAMNISYGNEASIQLADKISKTIKFGCYRSSVDMAKELGPFPIFNYDQEKDSDFIGRINKEVLILDNEIIYGKDIVEDMKKYGGVILCCSH